MKHEELTEELMEIAIAAGCVIRQEVHTDGFKGLANGGRTIIYQIRGFGGWTGHSPIEYDVTELVFSLVRQTKKTMKVLCEQSKPTTTPLIGDEWKPCKKLPVIVHVREQRQGESHVSTREGITPIKSDDLIMRGVEGEEYPIGRDIFTRTYELI